MRFAHVRYGRPVRTVDISCVVRQTREKAIAVADGTTDPEHDDREKWFWLPRSQVTVNEDGTVTMPEWLAKERGLI